MKENNKSKKRCLSVSAPGIILIRSVKDSCDCSSVILIDKKVLTMIFMDGTMVKPSKRGGKNWIITFIKKTFYKSKKVLT